MINEIKINNSTEPIGSQPPLAVKKNNKIYVIISGNTKAFLIDKNFLIPTEIVINESFDNKILKF